MSDAPTAAIVGLGLIGGSLARDLAARGIRILGYDCDPDVLAQALSAGIVRQRLSSTMAGLAAADWVVLATPPDAAPEAIERMRGHVGRSRLITDVGSVKRGIVAAAERLGLGSRFVGAHPIAGDTRSGWGASRAGLFAGARVYLCPTRETTPAARGEAEALWGLCGARTEVLSPEAHDRTVAWTSHLPQVAASALALALGDAGIAARDLGPGGRSATRLAASPAGMWTGIASENADALAPALAALEARLAEARRALERRDRAALHAFFEGSATWAAQDG